MASKTLESWQNIYLHSESQWCFLGRHKVASFTSLSLVTITSLLGDLKFYYPNPTFQFSVILKDIIGIAALLPLSRNHGNSAGSSGLNCPRLFGWNDRFFVGSYVLTGSCFRYIPPFFSLLFADPGVPIPPY